MKIIQRRSQSTRSKTTLGLLLAVSLSPLLLGPVTANDKIEDDPGGVLNPEEMTLQQSLARASRGDVNMVICAQGYLMTKKGDHKQARELFEACAKKGWTGTMTWMSYMDQNGFGADEDAKASAEWDRKAAQLGDPIGEFNYGLNLLRGYGVKQDETLGKTYVDRAAKRGVKAAIELREGNYDPEVVTPDADSWKFKKRVF
ncbi:MAG: tetratricopeptide repeat protein [Hyphomicrobiales bacterium]